MPPNIRLYQLLFTGRAENIHDVNVFVSDALRRKAIYNFIHCYSTSLTEMYEGMITMGFQCGERDIPQMKQAVRLLMTQLIARAESDDLHVLGETINFSDEFTGERIDLHLSEARSSSAVVRGWRPRCTARFRWLTCKSADLRAGPAPAL
jgi:hypothetical protein